MKKSHWILLLFFALVFIILSIGRIYINFIIDIKSANILETVWESNIFKIIERWYLILLILFSVIGGTIAHINSKRFK